MTKLPTIYVWRFSIFNPYRLNIQIWSSRCQRLEGKNVVESEGSLRFIRRIVGSMSVGRCAIWVWFSNECIIIFSHDKKVIYFIQFLKNDDGVSKHRKRESDMNNRKIQRDSLAYLYKSAYITCSRSSFNVK